MSPLAITGMRDRRASPRAIVSYSTAPDEQRRRACGRARRAPRCRRPRRCARSRRRCGSPGLGPVRILSVTGTSTAAHDGGDDPRHQRLVGKQRRAGRRVADLLRRAAHVDVDDLRAALDVVARRVGHQSPDRRRRSARRSARPRRAWSVRRRDFVGAPQLRIRRHHLRHRVAGAQALAEHAERTIGDARHRRDR